MCEVHLQDQRARDRIEQDLDTNLVVEAGAGSGKTTSLVNRLAALLYQGKATIDQIAAVTFTRKAAAEIRGRLQIALEKRMSGSTPEQRERLENALEGLPGAAIGTVHSFCGRILRLYAVEANVDPAFEELDEEAAERFLDDVWEDHLETMRGHDLYYQLLNRGVEPGDLRDFFHRLSMYRDVRPVVAKASQVPDLSGPVIELRKFVNSLRPHIPNNANSADDLQEAVEQALRVMNRNNFSDLRDTVRVLEAFEKAKVTLKCWTDREWAKALRDVELPKFQHDVVIPTLRAWRSALHALCVEFVKPALERALEKRRAFSFLDFADLLILTRDLLRTHSWVRKELAERFPRILVDEFQDTDPVQAQILFYLAGDDPPSGEDWHQRPLRPGSLFLVGDPKQSIYRFRRADIEMYQRVKEAVVAHGGEVLSLSRNFRSVPQLCDYVNNTFKNIFPKQPTPEQAAYGPMQPHRGTPPNLSCGVHRLELPRAENKAELLGHEAEKVATWVRQALDKPLMIQEANETRPVKGSDILILTWHKEPLAGLALALERYGVPVDLAGEENPGENPWVRSFMNLLRAIATPEDGAALTGVLTGALFGLSWEDLWRHRKANGAFRLNGAKNQGHEPVLKALHFLGNLREGVLSRRPVAAVEWILNQIGLTVLAASEPGGGTAAGRFEKLLDWVREAVAQGKSDFPSMVDEVVEVCKRGTPLRNVLAGTSDAVRLMNLHKAKGLEAPVVILAGAWNWGSQKVELRVERDKGGDGIGYFAVWKPKGKYGRKLMAHPEGWEGKEKEELSSLEAEEKRLLYVAATRAAQLLVISQPKGKARVENASPWKNLVVASLPAFPIEHMDPPRRPKACPDFEAFQEEKGKTGKRRQSAAQPSWTRHPVTAFVGSEAPSPQGPKYGPAWGTVVHKCLERLFKNSARELPDALLRQILRGEGLEPDQVLLDELKAVLQKVQRHALWNRITQSHPVLTEVPFCLNTAKAGEALKLMEGIVDLAFRENGAWVLVDYKTQEVEDDSTSWIAHYGPQLRAYAEAWKHLTEEPVKEAWLFFVHSGAQVKVPLEDEERS